MKKNEKKNKQGQAKKQPAPKNPKAALKTYEFDAAGQVLGRLATQVAVILLGKQKPSFRPNKVSGDKVIIKNAEKIIVTGNKLTSKTYYRHTGYLGHLKSETLGQKLNRNPREVLKKAIFGMLPKNKLRKIWMKNLTIYAGDKNV